MKIASEKAKKNLAADIKAQGYYIFCETGYGKRLIGPYRNKKQAMKGYELLKKRLEMKELLWISSDPVEIFGEMEADGLIKSDATVASEHLIYAPWMEIEVYVCGRRDEIREIDDMMYWLEDKGVQAIRKWLQDNG